MSHVYTLTILQLGLILNIIGTILIFLYGFPSKINLENSKGSIIYSELDYDENQKRLKNNKRIKFGGYCGIFLLFIGFIFQYFDTIK